MTQGAELHDAVEQRDRLSLAAKDARDVERDGGLPGAALRRIDRHDVAVLLPLVPADVERDLELVRAPRKNVDRVDAKLRLRLDRPLRHGDDDDARARRDIADLLRDVEARN